VEEVALTDDAVQEAMLEPKKFAKMVSMTAWTPNLSALIGEIIGARLISHAGSLINLAKYPASTVQILGAEKALFRALKTRGNTPKYGLIFHSSFIGRAQQKKEGSISRSRQQVLHRLSHRLLFGRGHDCLR